MKRLSSFLLLVCLCSCGKSPQLLWKFSTGAAIYSSPAISGNKVIVASTDGFVYALDRQSGSLVWKQQILPHVVGTPLPRGDSVYIGGGKGDMFSLNEKTGEVQWQFSAGDGYDYEACADDTGLYFGNLDSYFYKIDFTGKKIWDFKTGFYIWSTCKLYKDEVIFGAWDYNLYALDRQTGKLKWKSSSGHQLYGEPELAEDRVYFATHTILRGVSASTGQILMDTKTTYLDNVTYWNGFLWTAEDGLTKRKLDGSKVGSITFNTFSLVKPVFTGKYFILGGRNNLYGVSPELKILWKATGGGDFWKKGVVGDDTYYSGNRDGSLYAFKLP